MTIKEMIKVLKAIKKHKPIEKQFNSNEYKYEWQKTEDARPNFQKWKYRVKP